MAPLSTLGSLGDPGGSVREGEAQETGSWLSLPEERERASPGNWAEPYIASKKCCSLVEQFSFSTNQHFAVAYHTCTVYLNTSIT